MSFPFRPRKRVTRSERVYGRASGLALFSTRISVTMADSERRFPALKDPETGVFTAFPRSKRPRAPVLPVPTSAPPSARPAFSFPPKEAQPPPERRPDFRELTAAQIAKEPSAEPTLSSGPSDASLDAFFPKPLVGVDPKTDKIVQKVESVDLLRDIRPSDGSAISLAAVGPEDRWLTVDPSYSPFRQTYRRHTPFAISQIEREFEKGFRFGATNISFVSLSGDAITGGVLEVRLPALQASGTWVPFVGLAIVREWRLLIGDQLVQSVPRDWQFFKTVGRTPISKAAGLLEMVGAAPLDVSVEHVLYVPIPFFFADDTGTPRLTLPVSSLSNASVSRPTRLELIAEDVQNLVNLTYGSPQGLPTSMTATLVFDYVYMSDQERAAFVAFGHRMLFSAVVAVEERAYRLQGDGKVGAKASTPVQLDGVNKNVTNIVIVASEEDAAQRKTLFKYGSIDSIDLFLNGQQKRFQTRPGDYFSKVVPYMHGGVPEYGDKRANVYQYSFTAPGTYRPRDNAGHVNIAAFNNPTLRANGVRMPDGSVPSKVTVMCEYLNFLTTENGFARVETL